MMKGILKWTAALSLLSAICTADISAQQERGEGRSRRRVNVTGRIVETSTNTPIGQATVRLLQMQDSSFVGGVASETDGTFMLRNIARGAYLLHISFVGYESVYRTLTISGRTNPVNVGTITMDDGAIALDEAVVVGKAPEVVVRNDTTEYNADSYKVAEGSVLEDLLKKMPGVEVSDEGVITVNGKEVKKIMVDGKEFFSADPKVASKNLPSNMVEKVQVLDRLSDMARMTGFNDGDEETVINLSVKPGMKEGWFGNAFAGYGSQDRYEGNGMVNRFVGDDQITAMGGFNNTNNMGFSDLASTMFAGMGGGRRGMWFGGGNGITTSGNIGGNVNKVVRKNVLEVNGNARYAHSDNLSESRTSRRNILSADSSSYESEADTLNSISENIGVNLRIDWRPDSVTQLIFRPDFGYSRSQSNETGSSETLGGDSVSVNRGRSSSTSSGEGYNASLRVEFSRKLNTAGRVLSGSLQAGLNDSYSNGANTSHIDYLRLGRTYDLDQRIRYDNTSHNYRLFLSWVEPLGRNNFLQATYSYRYQEQSSLKNAFNFSDTDGAYTSLDTTQSKNYLNTFVTQRASVGFKAVREKYNYTIGFNADPSYSRSKNFLGDTVFSDLGRQVINFSPAAEFRYNFDRTRNLRIDYDGTTSQPTLAQMQPVPDYTDPTNVKYGNPDLNPRYANNLNIRWQSFNQETQFACFLMANANYVINEIVSYVINLNDGSGNRITRYRNVDGNYGANLRFMLNTPFKNRKFTFHNMAWLSYSNANGFLGSIVDDDTREQPNVSRNLQLMEACGFDFRSDYLDLGINGNIRYNGATYSLQKENDQQVFNYSIGGRTTVYLPANFKLESDVNWSANSGYTEGYKQNEVLWNASASKSFLKGNAATVRLKVYDILQQRSNISRSITANYVQDAEYNTLSSYFMCHFIYRFSAFKGGAGVNDAFGGRRRFEGGGPPPRL